MFVSSVYNGCRLHVNKTTVIEVVCNYFYNAIKNRHNTEEQNWDILKQYNPKSLLISKHLME